MAAITVTVNSGVCGMISEITAASQDEQNVVFNITSTCRNIQGLAAKLPQLDAYNELGAGFNGALHQAARASIPSGCSGCLVPGGLFKAMQVAAGLALPGDAAVCFTRQSAE